MPKWLGKSPSSRGHHTSEIPLFLHPDGKTVGFQSIGMTGCGVKKGGYYVSDEFRVMSYPPGRIHGEYMRRWAELKFAREPITPHFALMLTVFLVADPDRAFVSGGVEGSHDHGAR